jgi:hypothetical protein
VVEYSHRVTKSGEARYFDAVVDMVDDDEPSFAAWVAVSEHTVEIHAFDITLGAWDTAEISAVSTDEGILIEVPGAILSISCNAVDELLKCLTEGIDTSAA